MQLSALMRPQTRVRSYRSMLFDCGLVLKSPSEKGGFSGILGS
jgi:hypothetical protein